MRTLRFFRKMRRAAVKDSASVTVRWSPVGAGRIGTALIGMVPIGTALIGTEPMHSLLNLELHVATQWPQVLTTIDQQGVAGHRLCRNDVADCRYDVIHITAVS